MLKSFAKREGCIIGICDAAPLLNTLDPNTPFVSKDIKKRTDPSANLPGAKSIIAVGVQNTIKAFPPMPEDAGILSALCMTEDYHVVVKALLRKLVSELQKQFHFMYTILVDSPTLDERAIAMKADLGFIGRNGLVISKEFGSRFNIGLLISDIPAENFDKPESINGFCLTNCNRCIQACPTGALLETDNFQVSRCVSYLTQKDKLTSEEAKMIGRNLYGCDICQDVCPKNPSQPIAWANPDDWISMSDEEFAKAYGNSAMLWRGTALLKRNAEAVKKNLQALQAPPQN